ncbi:MAG: preprotein translocase subunit SecA [Anaerohalosphaeraceae bacterium]|nr:preprotein translocase subunit SecA [Anaerohalosphaeraceae bacterium]
MIDKINKFLVRLFGSRNERLIKSYMSVAVLSGEFERELSVLDDTSLSAKTAEFKSRIDSGQSLDDLIPEVFAVVRETAKRKLEMRHFDVQLIGGKVLFEGKIAEMATGEGKTLVATLATYMVYLTGRKVHVITVNDYLAKRDSEWMTPVYNALGMTCGAIQAGMDTSGAERKDKYACDITYGTNNEFGFDYLRDNMKVSASQLAQGPLDYAIIDEVDSILIDEARTPLIISGPAQDDVSRYKKADAVAQKIIQLQAEYDRLGNGIASAGLLLANARGEFSEAKKAKDQPRMKKAQEAIEKFQAQIDSDELRLESAQQYYEVELDRKSVHLNHDGLGKAQELAGVGSFFTGSNMEWPHLLEQSLRARIAFEKEKDYVVMDGKVVIVDEFTGRLMEGRQWSDGLHQAVEAKENVEVKQESQTLATITLQNFFRLYGQLSGMTGTALTEADEFMQIYKLEVVTIPTNKPCARDDRDDMIYRSMKEKFNAIVENINEESGNGRPVLVGTISVEKSEEISKALSRKYGIEHEVLNAKQHAREALIVEKAGWQHTDRAGKIRGNVTIATNMAGRGTDIKLGEGVADLGGLHIVGTERHESRRIDNQLRGRAGRQGDKGSSQFFLSFDDDLMKLFGGERIPKLLNMVGWKDDEPILHPAISRQIAKVQKKVEQRNFESRKSLLEYDEVMDYQRKTFYSRRRQIIAGQGLKEIINEMIDSVVETNCRVILAADYRYDCIVEWARSNFGLELSSRSINGLDAERIEERIKKNAKLESANSISIQLGEYLEDFSDPSSWNIEGLCKWAMSNFSVSFSANKARQMTSEEIEQTLAQAAADQIDKKNYSRLEEFLAPNFPAKTLADWAFDKFEVKLSDEDIEHLKAGHSQEKLVGRIHEKYTQREIEYPIDFAMSHAFGSEQENVYAYENICQWVKLRFGKDLSVSHLQNSSQKSIHQELLQISRQYHQDGLEKEIDEKIASITPEALADWAKQRFTADIDIEDLANSDTAKESLLDAGKNFIRTELNDLEKYVLIQIYDGAWKDHLYSMDHLKSSIFMRAFAEKDPKLEYKQEGFRMFSEMLDVIEDRVTDTIFKVRLAPGTRARSVWNVGAAKHDEVGQFAVSQRQRAAAQAPQGEAAKVKQIKLQTPKVGRNDPCPCGSGKKYKKCCGSL